MEVERRFPKVDVAQGPPPSLLLLTAFFPLCGVPQGLPVLDPEDDMRVDGSSYRKLVRKAR